MASMQEIDDLFAKVAAYPVEGMRFVDLEVAHTHWHTRWKDEPATLLWAVVHMVAHGSSLDGIMETILRGEAPEGMVPREDADRALEDIRKLP